MARHSKARVSLTFTITAGLTFAIIAALTITVKGGVTISTMFVTTFP